MINQFLNNCYKCSGIVACMAGCEGVYQFIVEIEPLAIVEAVVVGRYRLRNVEVGNANRALHQILRSTVVGTVQRFMVKDLQQFSVFELV
jgi:hypothetical protein